jgi:hypothetical protein
MPSKKEAKKQSQEGYVKLSGWLIVNSKPLENLIYDPDFREKKVAELQRWINSTISERKMEEEVSLNRGFLKKKPLLKEVSVDKFSRKLSASLLRILLDSFNCEDGFYSNGQLYIGLCHFCGKIFVKNKITQKFCPNNTPDCRKKFNKAKEREIKKNGDF